MEKSEFIKDSVKRILGMMVMILVFTIAILVLCFSSLLVGQQETLKTNGEEFVLLDGDETPGEATETDGAVVVLNDDNLRMQVIKPLSPTKGVKEQ